MRPELAFVSVVLAALACGCGGSGASAPAMASSNGTRTVSFSLPSNEGALVSVPISGARSTVLDFFSPTCEPCKEKVPALHAKQSELAARGARLVLVGVVSDSESTDDARRALASWGVVAPFLVDRNGTGRREAGITALPATIILDASGAVRWVASSTSRAEDVVAALPE
ncbi:MAG: TlpA family protein disulfide reductase [Myxococcales bacterium]|nr:TlpA family protein disulfide reductase [Myxococcales bacterium]